MTSVGRLTAFASVAVLAGLALAAPPGALADSGWRWPLRGAVIATFETGPDRFAPGQHRGIDIAAAAGTPVRSACEGRVSFAGFAATAGRTVSVACGPLTASYLHLRSMDVRAGSRVEAGARLGEVGTSGRPRRHAVHLHFGVRWTGRRGAYVDPLSLLREGAPSQRPPVAPTLRRTPGPLGRAPRPLRPRPAPGLRTPVLRSLPARSWAGQPSSPPAPVPWSAWAGLALAASAVPGGLVRRRRRRAARAGLSGALRSSEP